MTMSFFGKLKNLHSGPPAPPRRTDDNAGWPQDEFDDEEEGDMYEAPPCERPQVKVPQKPVEEDVYLDTSSPAVPQRQVAPPPRPVKPLKLPQREQFNFDPKNKKPPEIDRTEKPGRKKMMPPPSVRPSPAPAPDPNTEEDLYLVPNEGQEETDEVYLEPTPACSPPPRTPIRMPLPPKTPVPAPIPVAKPPVPRAKSSALFPSLNEVNTAPSIEARRATFPTKLPPPAPGNNAPSPPMPPSSDTKPLVSSGVTRGAKQSGTEAKGWFVGDCNRKQAEDLLKKVNKDGAFLIRHSSTQSTRQPYTLAVLYQQKVYNIPIRFLGETRGYALGKEGKKNEEIFINLEEMISHHKNNQLLLIDSKSQAKHTAYLTHPARL
ncbi:SH2 domain-containing protein 6 [Halichoeres trimaculatus]|uniref:SH2 domain-containing protein 6 n=1 Tax=Halichoeres trimaculatus TaxID=147232 RepID=UPI003D9F4D81